MPNQERNEYMPIDQRNSNHYWLKVPEGFKTCQNCNGYGYVKWIEENNNPYNKECWVCFGMGYVSDKK